MQPEQGMRRALGFNLEIRGTSERLQVLDSRLEVLARTKADEHLILGMTHQKWPSDLFEVGRNADWNLLFNLPLTVLQLEEIEEARGNQPLQLRLHLTILGTRPDQNPPIPFRWFLEKAITIDKARWVETFLPALHMGKVELWEVRFPSLPTPKALAEEYTLLQRALHDYNNGEYEDSFNDCRQLFETLEKRADELSLPTSIGSEEWGRAKRYLSMALHSQQEIPRRIVRADAEFAISITRATFRRVAAALASPKKAASGSNT